MTLRLRLRPRLASTEQCFTLNYKPVKTLPAVQSRTEDGYFKGRVRIFHDLGDSSSFFLIATVMVVVPSLRLLDVLSTNQLLGLEQKTSMFTHRENLPL